MLNLGIFGLGRAGKIHYENAISSKFFNVKFVSDVYNISEQIDKDVKYIDFNNINEVEENISNVDAIIVSSPTDTHYQVIKLGIKHKKHIFVEKPIMNNFEQITECFDLAEKNKIKLFVGYNRRYDPTIMDIKKRVDNDEIGFINYALTISRDYPYPDEKFIKVSSGIFNDCATHDIDYLNWILGDKPISVNVCVDEHNNHEDYNFDHVLINLKYSLGTIASINLSRISTSYDQRCEFYGSKGEIVNNNFKQHAKLSFPERYKKAFEYELECFHDCIINNKKPIVTKDECLSNYTIASACQEAFDKNKKITIKYGNTFRNYDNASQAVVNNYKKARENQTMDFVLDMKKKYSKFEEKMDIWEMLEDLNNLIDVSDPDCSHPNLYHAIQTAEMIRKDGLPDWMQLMGLIHDIGKIMYKKGNDKEGTGKKEQWAMVGDTFFLGCQLPKGIIYNEFNDLNPDMKNDSYNTEYGIYQPKCGLDNMICSWGHDEYLYQILSSSKNPNSLPEEAKYIARFHSLYAYHDKQEYFRFQSEKDKLFFKTLKKFNKYDLYSKSDDIFDIEKLKPYYINLINKYFKNSFLFI